MTSISCPQCNGPVEQVGTNLTELGYLAEDQTHQCKNCKHSFALGEPIGEFVHEITGDVICDVCDSTGYLYQIHKTRKSDTLALRWKCPGCYYVWVQERGFENDAITVGYAEVMGENTDDGYGY